MGIPTPNEMYPDDGLLDVPFLGHGFPLPATGAAERHVERSIANPEIFVQTNVPGTVHLIRRAKEARHDAEKKTRMEGWKHLPASTDKIQSALGSEGFIMETTPIHPHSPYSGSTASAGHFAMAFHDTYGMQIRDWLGAEEHCKSIDKAAAIGIVKTIDWYLEHAEWTSRATSGAYQSYYAEMYQNRRSACAMQRQAIASFKGNTEERIWMP